jgi:hypothetical protein
MEEPNFMMALLIRRPSSPSKDFYIFMESLVEELQQHWKGVCAIDAIEGKGLHCVMRFFGAYMIIQH